MAQMRTEEKKELIINVYQERSSMRGIERTFGVSHRTLSAWLKEQANDLPPLEETLQPVECKKIPALDVDELWSFVFRSKDKVWVWIAMNRETREIFASACGDRRENTCRILWDRVKKRGKRLILSVGIMPYGNSWHASYVRHFLFPNVLKCMRFV